MISQTIGFIGAGQMAQALAKGFLRAGLVQGEQLVAHDPLPATAERFAADVPGSRIATSNADVVAALRSAEPAFTYELPSGGQGPVSWLDTTR